MKRIILFLFLSLCLASGVMAQQRFVVTGVAQDERSGQPVGYATASLLRADSTGVVSGTTDDDGRFTLTAPGAGKYIVKLTYVGYGKLTRNVELTAEADSVDVGKMALKSNENILRSATVTGVASRVEQKGDTTMFSASAYRVPEGSTLEALVKQLPGVEVGDDGTIKWNGKTVSEFLINGKDFFKGDTQTAMKNLPTELISKIKAYDKKSDYTEQTGIDDGEETTVLDLTTKREFNQSWIANADVAYGNHDRYTARFFGTRFTDRSRVTAFGSLNNTNDRGFGGPRGFGRGGGGLVATKNAGMDFSWENGKKKREAGRFEIGGNVRYRHSDSDALSTSNSETFLTSGTSSSFSNDWSHNVNKSTSVNSNFRLQWSPDTMTNIIFRPSYSYSESKGYGSSVSATFNSDPYEVVGREGNPLDSIAAANTLENLSAMYPALAKILVNTNNRSSLSDSHSHNVSGSLNVIRRLNAEGRNVSLRANGGWSKSESNSYSISNIRYGQNDNGQSSFLNQYSTTPAKNYNYSARLGYVEPLGKNWFAEVRYQFSYKYQDSNRSRYNLDDLADTDGSLRAKYPWFSDVYGQYAGYGSESDDERPAIGTLPNRDDVLNLVRDLNNSQYATYKYYDHTATAGIRYNTKAIRFNAGVDFNPEKTKMAYNRPGQHIDTLITRNVFKVSPQVRLRYQFSQTNQLEIRYRGSSSQPSMTDLLAVVDDSDPLNISMGNPGLKPSWSNTLRINYNGYNPTLQQGIMTGIDFSQTSNSVSNRMVYDETTGTRYMRPDNINGNFNGRGMFMFNTALGAQKLFNISTFTAVSYDNAVGYISRTQSRASSATSGKSTLMTRETTDDATTAATTSHDYNYYLNIFNSAASEKNTTRTLGVDENLNLSYRASWFDIGVLGRLNYQHARATIQDNANMDTWNFAYGANANFNFDFGLSISTDIRMNSRRGYSDASMNTNELLWNAQISQSFLKQKNLTLSVQFYDILQQQSNISRTLTATRRTDSWSNAINSYFMVHAIYRLSIFPGGSSSQDGNNKGERMGPPDMRGPGGMPMRRMGMPMGRPGRF